jgi:hypothetical protein
MGYYQDLSYISKNLIKRDIKRFEMITLQKMIKYRS